MTAGSRRTSSAVPSQIVLPSASTWIRSHRRMIRRRSWSTMRTAQPSSSRTRLDRLEQRRPTPPRSSPRRARREAGTAGRLPGRARSRHAAAGRRRGSPRAGRGPGSRRSRSSSASTRCGVLPARDRAYLDVLGDGHLREQPDLLEGASDAEPGEVVRPVAGRVDVSRSRSARPSGAGRRSRGSRAWSCRFRSGRSARRSRPPPHCIETPSSARRPRKCLAASSIAQALIGRRSPSPSSATRSRSRLSAVSVSAKWRSGDRGRRLGVTVRGSPSRAGRAGRPRGHGSRR